MTPPKKLSAPKAQTVNLKIKARGTKREPVDRRQKAMDRADELETKLDAKRLLHKNRLDAFTQKCNERIAKMSRRFLHLEDRLVQRAIKLRQFAAIDPQVARQEKARAAAVKRAEKLQAKLNELQRVIDGGKV